MSEEECIELKKEFYNFSEKEYFYGWVDDEAYEMFNEVVILELERKDARNQKASYIENHEESVE